MTKELAIEALERLRNAYNQQNQFGRIGVSMENIIDSLIGLIEMFLTAGMSITRQKVFFRMLYKWIDSSDSAASFYNSPDLQGIWK